MSDPKIAMVVFVDEPGSENYYGGQVAAPVFATVASDTLRLLNVKPDKNQASKSKLNVAKYDQQGDADNG